MTKRLIIAPANAPNKCHDKVSKQAQTYVAGHSLQQTLCGALTYQEGRTVLVTCTCLPLPACMTTPPDAIALDSVCPASVWGEIDWEAGLRNLIFGGGGGGADGDGGGGGWGM